MRAAVLDAASTHAAFDGFTDKVLAKAGQGSRRRTSDAGAAFPRTGPLSLIEFYSAWADAEMEKRLAAMDLKAMKIRERIAAAVKARGWRS